METNSAVWYANFVRLYHEKYTLLKIFQKYNTLLCHLVEDQFGLVSLDQIMPKDKHSIETIYCPDEISNHIIRGIASSPPF